MIQAFVASAFFSIGLYGILTRRDIIAVLASVEVMLGGGLVLLAAVGAKSAPVNAEAITLLVLVVGAAEAAVGLALMVSVAKSHRGTRIDELTEVRG